MLFTIYGILPLYKIMKKITLNLDDEEYSLLEQDRGELSQQKYIIRLLKEYQLKIVLSPKKQRRKK